MYYLLHRKTNCQNINNNQFWELTHGCLLDSLHFSAFWKFLVNNICTFFFFLRSTFYFVPRFCKLCHFSPHNSNKRVLEQNMHNPLPSCTGTFSPSRPKNNWRVKYYWIEGPSVDLQDFWIVHSVNLVTIM